MSEEIKLLSCPFCGSPVKLVGVGAWNKCSAAWCGQCEIYGPQMATQTTAAYAWNRRANKNPHCPGDGVACAPDGAGACVACDDGRGYCTPKESQS